MDMLKLYIQTSQNVASDRQTELFDIIKWHA